MEKDASGLGAMLGINLVKLKPLQGFGLLLSNESFEQRGAVVRFRV